MNCMSSFFTTSVNILLLKKKNTVEILMDTYLWQPKYVPRAPVSLPQAKI